MKKGPFFLRNLSILILIAVIVLPGFKGDTKKKKLPKYVLIPGGSTMIEDRTVTMGNFWISAYEVSNEEYNAFLDNLQEMERIEEYETAKVRNENWKKGDGYNDPYAEYYHKHPAYGRYPAVNISHEGAKLFCKWLTENSAEENMKYRLPTKEEWIYASRGGFGETVYPWGGEYLKDKKGRDQCNYSKVGDEFIHYSHETEAYEIINRIGVAAITAPVDSYWPNEYGLHNASGNVAEMVSETGIAMGGSWNSTGYDVRILSEMSFSGSNQFVGFRPVKVKK